MGVTEGKAKYARKTGPDGASKWNASKGRMQQNWSEGLARAGTPPGPQTTAAYAAGINAAQYRGGDPDKWERNFRAGIGR